MSDGKLEKLIRDARESSQEKQIHDINGEIEKNSSSIDPNIREGTK